MTFDVTWLSSQFKELDNLRIIGEGGQRWVFQCSHTDLGVCILKIVKPGKEIRIDREIEAFSRIPECPNVPSMYSVGKIKSPIGPLVWILEQFIPGNTLDNILKSRILNPNEVIHLGQDLLFVASKAEAVNVVHRDIKPDNIIIDSDGKSWLLDFGITRILDLESRTRSDALLGPHSPGYGAPEQFRNRKRDIDGRSDLFGIGIVLYESITGKNPFIEGASDKAEILYRTETQELPQLVLDWDRDNHLSTFIISLTQKYPHQRPRSCSFAKDWFDEIVEEIGGN